MHSTTVKIGIIIIIIIIIIITEAVGLQVSALLLKFDSTVIRVQIVVDRVILGQF
jgi:hypothetical protein